MAEYRFKRLAQMFWALEFTLIAVTTAQFVNSTDGIATGLILIFGSLISVYILVKVGKADTAANALFTLLIVAVSILMWRYGGLKDENLLAYPPLLIFAAVLGNSRLFIGLASYAILSIIVIAIATAKGWRVDIPQDNDILAAVNLTIILSLVIYYAWLLSYDLRQALTELSAENKRTLDSKSEIQKLLHHDSLTNLPNRILAREQFLRARAFSSRNNKLVGLMFLDLDNFKVINDSFGHQFGDKVLVRISSRLRSTLRESDSVCRQGGDEFLVIAGEVESEEQIAIIATKLLAEIRRPIQLDETTLIVTASIGIAVVPNDGEDFDAICRSSDMAMYAAKEKGRNDYRFFSTNMEEQAERSLHLLSDMRSAIALEQFELYYQPKIDLTTDTVIGAEALIRWDHPTRGTIPPLDFIPLAERSGVIVELSDWIVETACRECKRWHDDGYTQMNVAVNVSPVQLKREGMAGRIEHALTNSGLPATCLELELTESMLIDDSDVVKDTLTELRHLGAKLSIDDFGTGYSNLSYLKRFDVNVLKIDQSFIGNVATSSQDLALVRAIIQMSAGLNLQTVAEGIETAEVANTVKGMNCDIGQGYYWSKPLPADQFMEYLAAYMPNAE